MPIRSQVDTSMYGRSGGREASIGDILGIVNTIRNAAQSSRDRDKLKKEEDDLKFVNSTIGKYMQGYAGNDPNDLYQRRQGAYNEILTRRPELQSYIGKSQDADMKGQFEADSNRATLAGVQQDNLKAQMEWKMKRATDATQGLADVSDQFGFSKWRDDYSDVVGDKITPYYEDFVNSNNPADVFWLDGAGKVKQKRLADATQQIEDRDRKIAGDEADTKYKNAQSADLYSQIKKRQWDMDNPKTDIKSKDKLQSLEQARIERADVNRLISDLIRPVGKDANGNVIYAPNGAVGMDPRGLSQFWRGSEQSQFTKKIDQLRSKIALQNRAKLKGQGQISDREQETLYKASTSLGSDLNAKNFIQELTNVQRMLNEIDASETNYYNSLIGGGGATFNQNSDRTPAPDSSGFTVGQKRFSKKYGRELTYIGGGEWE